MSRELGRKKKKESARARERTKRKEKKERKKERVCGASGVTDAWLQFVRVEEKRSKHGIHKATHSPTHTHAHTHTYSHISHKPSQHPQSRQERHPLAQIFACVKLV